MKRRSFLASLFAASVLDPERLLWIPGQRVFSIPAVVPVDEFLDGLGWVDSFLSQEFYQSATGPNYIKSAVFAGGYQ